MPAVNAFVAAQSKVLKYATDNAAWCVSPANRLTSGRDHKTSEIHTKFVRLPPRAIVRRVKFDDALSAVRTQQHQDRTRHI
jgi:hypothetical protein